MAAPIIQVLGELYKTILTMANDPLDELRPPPLDGPGHILADGVEEQLAAHKTPQVTGLIKHLPYASYRQLAPGCRAIDYAPPAGAMSPYSEPRFAWCPVEWMHEGADLVLPHELPLTILDDGFGQTVVLDTETWELRVYDGEWSLRGCTVHNVVEEKCPPICRARCGLEVGPAVDVLSGWLQKFRDLEWMVRQGDPEIICGDEDYVEAMQKIFREHGWPHSFGDPGWPDGFRGQECKEALDKAPGPCDDVDEDEVDTSDDGLENPEHFVPV